MVIFSDVVFCRSPLNKDLVSIYSDLFCAQTVRRMLQL